MSTPGSTSLPGTPPRARAYGTNAPKVSSSQLYSSIVDAASQRDDALARSRERESSLSITAGLESLPFQVACKLVFIASGLLGLSFSLISIKEIAYTVFQPSVEEHGSVDSAGDLILRVCAVPAFIFLSLPVAALDAAVLGQLLRWILSGWELGPPGTATRLLRSGAILAGVAYGLLAASLALRQDQSFRRFWSEALFTYTMEARAPPALAIPASERPPAQGIAFAALSAAHAGGFRLLSALDRAFAWSLMLHRSKARAGAPIGAPEEGGAMDGGLLLVAFLALLSMLLTFALEGFLPEAPPRAAAPARAPAAAGAGWLASAVHFWRTHWSLRRPAPPRPAPPRAAPPGARRDGAGRKGWLLYVATFVIGVAVVAPLDAQARPPSPSSLPRGSFRGALARAGDRRGGEGAGRHRAPRRLRRLAAALRGLPAALAGPRGRLLALLARPAFRRYAAFAAFGACLGAALLALALQFFVLGARLLPMFGALYFTAALPPSLRTAPRRGVHEDSLPRLLPRRRRRGRDFTLFALLLLAALAVFASLVLAIFAWNYAALPADPTACKCDPLSKLAYTLDPAQAQQYLDARLPGWGVHAESGHLGVRFVEYRRGGTSPLAVVAVRGTTGYRDWMQNISIWLSAAAVQVAASLGSFMSTWPTGAIALLIKRLASLVPCAATKGTGHVRALRAREPSLPVLLAGHSLGGGLAKLVGAKLSVPAVTFSAPGLLYNSLRFHVTREALDATGVTVVPAFDYVPTLDLQSGLQQAVRCPAHHPFSCHMMCSTLCELEAACGAGG
eukprot:tig00021687_g23109.t1